MTEADYVCLEFDYRGFAKSEGTPGRVILDEQVILKMRLRSYQFRRS
jgi:hypothetical protein